MVELAKSSGFAGIEFVIPDGEAHAHGIEASDWKAIVEMAGLLDRMLLRL